MLTSRVMTASPRRLLLLLIMLCCCCCCWPAEIFHKNAFGRAEQDMGLRRTYLFQELSNVKTFAGHVESENDFRRFSFLRSHFLVGSKNKMFNVSLSDLSELMHLEWRPKEDRLRQCNTTAAGCDNHIRLMYVNETSGRLFVCGTNVDSPRCRSYRPSPESGYLPEGTPNVEAQRISPSHPESSNTWLVTADAAELYAAVWLERSQRGLVMRPWPVITYSDQDSALLDRPVFVDSFEFRQHVYFAFREPAVENAGCGRPVFSRIARLCKRDTGGKRVNTRRWTSFFKARLNCSIPGGFPFHYNELQSMSVIGKGNFRFTNIYGNRTEMFYGIFQTQPNSLMGAAVCAFTMESVQRAFLGSFLEQDVGGGGEWRNVSHPQQYPHPARQCLNSTSMTDKQTTFSKYHPMMASAVDMFGGEPIFKQTNFHYAMTAIAVDFQFKAADAMFYDILFIGTDDGRVVKAVNRGESKIETIIIEELQVFQDGQPVEKLHIHRDNHDQLGVHRLIIASRKKIRSLPLHRCGHHNQSCSACVRLQDPYCSWSDNKKSCLGASITGVQSIKSGRSKLCNEALQATSSTSSAPPPPPLPAAVTCAPCLCPTCPVFPHLSVTSGTQVDTRTFPATAMPDTDASTYNFKGGVYTAGNLALAIILTLILALVLGFVCGYVLRDRINSRPSSQPSYTHTSIDTKTYVESNNYNTVPAEKIVQKANHKQNNLKPVNTKHLNGVLPPSTTKANQVYL